MPVVKVLPEAYDVDAGKMVETNRIFNSLASQRTSDGSTAPERFMYTVKYENGQRNRYGIYGLIG